jgi:hypothetical protein
MSAPPASASHETYAFVEHRGRVSKISVYLALDIAGSSVTRGFTEDKCATNLLAGRRRPGWPVLCNLATGIVESWRVDIPEAVVN